MAQKDLILKMLKDAGSTGVTNHQFFNANLPRAAARIFELRADYKIARTTRTDEAGNTIYTYIYGGPKDLDTQAGPSSPERTLDTSQQTTDSAGGDKTFPADSLPSTGSLGPTSSCDGDPAEAPSSSQPTLFELTNLSESSVSEQTSHYMSEAA